jgi:hypothetical protein
VANGEGSIGELVSQLGRLTSTLLVCEATEHDIVSRRLTLYLDLPRAAARRLRTNYHANPPPHDPATAVGR